MRSVLGLALASVLVFSGACSTEAPSSSNPSAAQTLTSPSPSVPAADASPESFTPSAYPWLVTKVVDGDTIYVSGPEREIKVRLIGVNTPETKHPTKPVECFGPEASAFATERLSGQYVSLVEDVSQGSEDKYGRALAYVYTQDGSLFNLDLIAGGYAYEYTYADPYKFQAEFRAAQGEAEASLQGLWGRC